MTRALRFPDRTQRWMRASDRSTSARASRGLPLTPKRGARHQGLSAVGAELSQPEGRLVVFDP